MNTSCTGVIKLEPLANYLKQYKEGSVVEQIEQGSKHTPERERERDLLFSNSIHLVLQTYQDHPKLTSTQFFDLIMTIHQTLNESSGGNEKVEELLKFIENFQAPV